MIQFCANDVKVEILLKTATSLPLSIPIDGREWGQEEKGTTEDEMAGWHH